MKALLSIVIFFLLIGVSIGQPQLPDGFSYKIVCELEQISCFCFLPDGSLLIGRQNGEIYQFKEDSLSTSPVLDIPSVTGEDKGLIGIEADPNFETNQYIYVNYTLEDFSNNRVSRFPLPQIHEDDGHGGFFRHGHYADEEVLLDLSPLVGPWHVGGSLQFDNEGHLFVTTGDNSFPENSQDPNSYHGKVLRINKDGSVPDDNPFLGQGEVMSRVWGLGLRNPYTAAYDTITNRYFINNVGLESYEEIHDATLPGGNFGWPLYEGFEEDENFDDPIYAYERAIDRTDTTGTAITGGAFYPDQGSFPSEYYGKYFFMDFEGNWINYLDPDNPSDREIFATDLPRSNVYLRVGPDGSLYYVSRLTNYLYKIEYHEPLGPIITQSPLPENKISGKTTTFLVSASGAEPLSYQWYHNGEKVGSDNARLRYRKTDSTKIGLHYVRVANAFDTVYSDTVQLNVFSEESVPSVEITVPTEDTTYIAGDTIWFEGSATDLLDGQVSSENFKWIVDFHHDEHVHDQPPVAEGVDNGFYVIPRIGEIDFNVYFKVRLNVTNSNGFENEAERIFSPELSEINFETKPAGLEVRIDGGKETAPHTQKFVKNLELSINLDTLQFLNGRPYEFVEWSNGIETPDQVIDIPHEDFSYTANFQDCGLPPLSPEELIVQDFTDSMVSLAWEKNPCTDKFIIEMQITGQNEFQSIDTVESDVYTAMIDDLEPNTNYLFRTRALNDFGLSRSGETVWATTKRSLISPKNIELIAYSRYQIDLNWENVVPADSIIIHRSLDESFLNTVVFRLAGDSRSFSDTSVVENNEYFYRLGSSIQDLGVAFSNVLSVSSLSEGCIEVPEKPSITSIIPSSNNRSITIEWKLDECVTGIEIDRFIDGQFELLDTLNGAESSYVVEEVPTNESSFYRIRFMNQSGVSEYSDVVFSTLVLDLKHRLSHNIILGPNPANKEVMISSNGLLSVEVYSINGKKMPLTTPKGEFRELHMDTSGFPDGVYILRFTTSDKKTLTNRLLINHQLK